MIAALVTATNSTPTGGSPVLRDIHLPPAPSWWPPAPGWWVLGGCGLILLIWFGTRLLRCERQRRRVRTVLREFDRSTTATDPAIALAAASALLRRAARMHDPAALQFEGDAWLAYLDGADAAKPFSHGDGRVLIDGVFGRTLDAMRAARALPIARRRLRELLETRHA